MGNVSSSLHPIYRISDRGPPQISDLSPDQQPFQDRIREPFSSFAIVDLFPKSSNDKRIVALDTMLKGCGVQGRTTGTIHEQQPLH